jgi:hypothetical protein
MLAVARHLATPAEAAKYPGLVVCCILQKQFQHHRIAKNKYVCNVNDMSKTTHKHWNIGKSLT